MFLCHTFYRPAYGSVVFWCHLRRQFGRLCGAYPEQPFVKPCIADELVATWRVHPLPSPSGTDPTPLDSGGCFSSERDRRGRVAPRLRSRPAGLSSLLAPSAFPTASTSNWRRRASSGKRMPDKSMRSTSRAAMWAQSLPCRVELCRRVWPRHQPNEVGRITTHSNRGSGLYNGVMTGTDREDVTPAGGAVESRPGALQRGRVEQSGHRLGTTGTMGSLYRLVTGDIVTVRSHLYLCPLRHQRLAGKW